MYLCTEPSLNVGKISVCFGFVSYVNIIDDFSHGTERLCMRFEKMKVDHGEASHRKW